MASKTIILILSFAFYINILIAEDHCKDHNEIFTCGHACQKTCDTLDQACPIINTTCSNGCFCKEGFARASETNDLCVPVEHCIPTNSKPSEQSSVNPHNCGQDKPDLESFPPIKCSGAHEVYQCGSACQTECATLEKPCPIINIRCNDRCYCKKGFARDFSGRCIPIKNCPPRNTA